MKAKQAENSVSHDSTDVLIETRGFRNIIAHP